MKNASTNTLAFLTIAALATVSSAQPESDIATPAGKVEITQGAPDLGQSEKENWLRLREERKLARQQILSDIKASVKAEKRNAEIKDIQQEIIQQEKPQQKAKNNLNENKLNAKGNQINKNKEKKGNGLGNLDKPRPGLLPHETPRPIEHISYPKESKF